MKNNATPKNDATQLDTGNYTLVKPQTKMEKAISYFIERGNEGMTHRDADRLYYDSCLNTTVSLIQSMYGIQVMRKPSSKTNAYGGKPFHKYWIAPGKERQRAIKIVQQMAEKRGVKPSKAA